MSIKWGMIGCGSVVQKKSGPGFYKASNSELYAVTDVVIENAEFFAKNHNIPKVYKTVDELLADPEIDAVYIATPPKFHKELAIKCAQQKKPAYVEKPLANTYEDCLEVIKEFEKADVPAFVAFYRRAMERFLKVKRIIESGEIGKVLYLLHTLNMKPDPEEYSRETLPWKLKPESSAGGKVIDMAIHSVDIFDYLLGEIEDVKSTVANLSNLYDVEDIGMASWRFSSGAVGSAAWCFTAFETLDRIEIVGDKGKITFPCFFEAPVVLENSSGKQTFDIPDPEHVAQPMIQTVVNDLLGIGKCESTLESGARASKVIDEILREYRDLNGFKL